MSFAGKEAGVRTNAYNHQAERDRKVQRLDSLRMDAFFVEDLPGLNKSGSVGVIAQRVQRYIPSLSAISRFSAMSAMAATRDLGMVASSFRRHGADISILPTLEPALLALSRRTREVPADTVFSYGSRNPRGKRMRTFTGHADERFFVDSVQRAIFLLYRVLEDLDEAQGFAARGEFSAERIGTAASRFERLVEIILSVYRRITPQFFTEELRPFFEPKIIGRRMYLAAGGAQLQFLFIDEIVWGVSRRDPVLARYYAENAAYQPVAVREREAVIADRPTLLECATKALRGIHDGNRVALTKSLEALGILLGHLEQFRVVHLNIARANMAIRPRGAVGSGGYDTTLLELLLANTTAARLTAKDCLRFVS